MSRKTSKRIILYQKYVDASEKISDPYWKEIFRKLGYGKVPGSFIVTKDTLSYRKRKKIQEVIQIPEVLDSKIISEIIEFFKKHTGKRSVLDLQKEKEYLMSIYQEPESIKNIPWKTLKKNKKKIELLTFNFITKEVKEKNLSINELKQLNNLIKLGLIIDIFDGFEFNEKEEPVWIKGLEFDSKKRIYRISKEKLEDLYNTIETKRSEEPNDISEISDKPESSEEIKDDFENYINSGLKYQSRSRLKNEKRSELKNETSGELQNQTKSRLEKQDDIEIKSEEESTEYEEIKSKSNKENSSADNSETIKNFLDLNSSGNYENQSLESEESCFILTPTCFRKKKINLIRNWNLINKKI